jgi:hypothetical protein
MSIAGDTTAASVVSVVVVSVMVFMVFPCLVGVYRVYTRGFCFVV